MLAIHDILQRFHGVTKSGKEYRARCPAHNDQHPSLCIREGDQAILFKCESRGCAVADIIGAASPPLTWHDILPEPHGNGATSRTLIYTATFCDEHGRPLYESLRYHPKAFSLRAADGSPSIGGVRRVLYRLRELKGQDTVWYVEGPQKADALWRLGIPATTHVGGAQGWTKYATDYLQQFRSSGTSWIVCLPDNDSSGEALTQQQVHDFTQHGFRTTILRLPGLPAKGDILDFLAAGGTTAQLLTLLAESPVIDAPPVAQATASLAFDPEGVEDAAGVIAEGVQIAEQGITWTVQDMIPSYGMLGMHVAAAKVGKTTLAQALAADVAMGRPFLERPTTRTKVLIIAAEDPPQYTAFLARHLHIDPDWLKFYRHALILDDATLSALGQYIRAKGIGFVLIASWQAVIRTLIRDENDNMAGARIVEQVKAVTRWTGIPWLIDAHAGKVEDQSDEADPTKAMRGNSAAAGSADYLLSLRYADGPFGHKRRLSGKGRFVNFQPVTLEYEPQHGTYKLLGDSSRVVLETTWRLIDELGLLTDRPQAATRFTDALAPHFPNTSKTALRRQIAATLQSQPGVQVTITKGAERNRTTYSRAKADDEDMPNVDSAYQ